MDKRITVVEHPLVQHKLTLLREAGTPTTEFRRLLREVGTLLACEATRDLPLEEIEVRTPLTTTRGLRLAGKKLALVGVLRAGSGLLDGMLDVLPAARVGHVGLYRDARTLEAVEYYLKLPADLDQRDVLLVDPMLATGNSAVAAASRVREARPRSLRFVCLLAAPEGIQRFHFHHPDVPVLTAAIDTHLDDHGYIVPGLGDAGDRLFGTRPAPRSSETLPTPPGRNPQPGQPPPSHDPGPGGATE